VRYRLMGVLLALGLLVTQADVTRVTHTRPMPPADTASRPADDVDRTAVLHDSAAPAHRLQHSVRLTAIAAPLRSGGPALRKPLFVSNCSFLF